MNLADQLAPVLALAAATARLAELPSAAPASKEPPC